MNSKIRQISKAIVVGVLLCPQNSFANDIGERLIASMGMPSEARAVMVCEGRETTALCKKLLGEPDYRDLWLETGDKLNRAEWILAERLAELKGAIDRQNKTVRYMIERAPKLPDGRVIFRDRNGNFFDLDGEQISRELAATAVKP